MKPSGMNGAKRGIFSIRIKRSTRKGIVPPPCDQITRIWEKRAAVPLNKKLVSARVVSVPCFELLASAPPAVRAAVIGEAPVRVGVEAAIRQGWDAIIGSDGAFVGMTGFGASAPAKDLYRHFGITAERVAEAALTKLSDR